MAFFAPNAENISFIMYRHKIIGAFITGFVPLKVVVHVYDFHYWIENLVYCLF